MLQTLSIRNVALIDSAEISFSEGLNVLSGETGAGKSVILDCIDFVLGAKADKSMIRYGADECFVRAEFSACGERVGEVLRELDIESEETLVISRRFQASGKGSVRINGCPATSAMLRRVTSLLVDVHGQSEHFFLLKESNQLHLLDKTGGAAVAAARDAVKEKLEARQEIMRSLAVFGGDEGERTRRADILRFQIDEIRAADVKDGEEEELLARRDKIRHSERILEGLETASRSLTADGSGTDAVRTARRALSSLVRYDASLAPLAERLDAAAAELDDIAETVDGLGSSYEFDEREAERVESRLDEIAALKRKYGASAADIRAFLQRAEAEYELLSGSSEKYAALTQALERADDALFSACEALTAVRKKAAERFSQRVAAELKTLNIPSAKFEISFRGYRRDEVGHADREGLDKVTFLFSANAGEPLKELGKIISGGEMSRFMLAIKAQISAEHEIGTYLFDEIDAGISGKTARVVAEKFCKIAKDTQIIAVSHLAQIAAAADREFLIEKTQTGDKTYTCIRPVEGTARIGEIARLLGGEETSELAFRHAEELLDNAAAYKKTLSQQ